MTRKEDVKQMSDILAGAAIKTSVVVIEDEESLRKRKVADNERLIRATGVVDLINRACDERLVSLKIGSRKKERPEVYLVSTDEPSVKVCFNYGMVQGQQVHDYIEAHIVGENLIISGEESYVVGKELTMVEALGQALANPVHVSWS